MKTIVIDGVEYALIPKEQLQPVANPPVAQPPQQTAPDNAGSPLDDFLGAETTDMPSKPIEDGLASLQEKREAIKVVVPQAMSGVPKAEPKKSGYRERFLKKELSPSEVSAPQKFHRELVAGTPEDPLIKADSNRPSSSRLFYGPGIELEGY